MLHVFCQRAVLGVNRSGNRSGRLLVSNRGPNERRTLQEAHVFRDVRLSYNRQNGRVDPVDETKRIALIEDNEADVFLIERALSATHRPFETSCYKDGAEALTVFLAAQETTLPDVILLDLNMPRCDGLEVLRQIRSSPKLASIPVGILTGSTAANDRQRASTIGATRYIHKASHYDAFISNVGQAVEAMLDERKLQTKSPETISVASDSGPLAKGKVA